MKWGWWAAFIFLFVIASNAASAGCIIAPEPEMCSGTPCIDQATSCAGLCGVNENCVAAALTGRCCETGLGCQLTYTCQACGGDGQPVCDSGSECQSIWLWPDASNICRSCGSHHTATGEKACAAGTPSQYCEAGLYPDRCGNCWWTPASCGEPDTPACAAYAGCGAGCNTFTADGNLCDGLCRDSSYYVNNNRDCGSCGNDCTAQGKVCSGTTCVVPPCTACLEGGVCYAIGSTRPSNPCETCGNSPIGPTWLNKNDNTALGSNQICCGGSVTTSNNDANCGTCGNSCDAASGYMCRQTNGAVPLNPPYACLKLSGAGTWSYPQKAGCGCEARQWDRFGNPTEWWSSCGDGRCWHTCGNAALCGGDGAPPIPMPSTEGFYCSIALSSGMDGYPGMYTYGNAACTGSPCYPGMTLRLASAGGDNKCHKCGNNVCDPGETDVNCAVDCPSSCPGNCPWCSGCVDPVTSQCLTPGTTCSGGLTCDGDTKQCESITCFSNAGCNDGNVCTTDRCINAGTASSYCSNNAVPPGTSCGVPNVCNNAGQCVRCTSNLQCNDVNSCTTDTCVNPGLPTSYCTNTVNTGASCGVPNVCSPTGQCVRCNNNAGCNDGNVCTTDVCINPGTVSSSCSNTAVPPGTSCGVPNVCSPAGQCVRCNSNAQCGDGNACTTDVCINPGTVSSSCSNTPVPPDTSCGAPNVCSNAGVCIRCNSNAQCNDNNVCTTDACSNPGTPASACVNTPTPGVSCGIPNTCSPTGQCVRCNNNAECNDGNTCTTDTCNNPGTLTSSCSYAQAPVGSPCSGGACSNTGACIDCDVDNDGYNRSFISGIELCRPAVKGLDCNDNNAGVNPGVTETGPGCYNNTDDNCNGRADYDGGSILTLGESTCAVGITAIVADNIDACAGPAGIVRGNCTFNSAVTIRSANATITQGATKNRCILTGWIGTKALFNCPLGGISPGAATFTCIVNQTRSYNSTPDRNLAVTIKADRATCSCGYCADGNTGQCLCGNSITWTGRTYDEDTELTVTRSSIKVDNDPQVNAATGSFTIMVSPGYHDIKGNASLYDPTILPKVPFFSLAVSKDIPLKRSSCQSDCSLGGYCDYGCVGENGCQLNSSWTAQQRTTLAEICGGVSVGEYRDMNATTVVRCCTGPLRNVGELRAPLTIQGCSPSIATLAKVMSKNGKVYSVEVVSYPKC